MSLKTKGPYFHLFRSTVLKLGALQKQVDLQGVFVKVGDLIKSKGFLAEFLENRRSRETQTPQENRQKSGASPSAMHLVCTLLIRPVSFHKAAWTGHLLSGPVLRDTARLSQRSLPIARYGGFGVSEWPVGCDTPPPFLSVSPWRACKVEVRHPPPQQKDASQRCLRDTT